MAAVFFGAVASKLGLGGNNPAGDSQSEKDKKSAVEAQSEKDKKTTVEAEKNVFNPSLLYLSYLLKDSSGGLGKNWTQWVYDSDLQMYINQGALKRDQAVAQVLFINKHFRDYIEFMRKHFPQAWKALQDSPEFQANYGSKPPMVVVDTDSEDSETTAICISKDELMIFEQLFVTFPRKIIKDFKKLSMIEESLYQNKLFSDQPKDLVKVDSVQLAVLESKQEKEEESIVDVESKQQAEKDYTNRLKVAARLLYLTKVICKDEIQVWTVLGKLWDTCNFYPAEISFTTKEGAQAFCDGFKQNGELVFQLAWNPQVKSRMEGSKRVMVPSKKEVFVQIRTLNAIFEKLPQPEQEFWLQAAIPSAKLLNVQNRERYFNANSEFCLYAPWCHLGADGGPIFIDVEEIRQFMRIKKIDRELALRLHETQIKVDLKAYAENIYKETHGIELLSVFREFRKRQIPLLDMQLYKQILPYAGLLEGQLQQAEPDPFYASDYYKGPKDHPNLAPLKPGQNKPR